MGQGVVSMRVHAFFYYKICAHQVYLSLTLATLIIKALTLAGLRGYLGVIGEGSENATRPSQPTGPASIRSGPPLVTDHEQLANLRPSMP